MIVICREKSTRYNRYILVIFGSANSIFKASLTSTEMTNLEASRGYWMGKPVFEETTVYIGGKRKAPCVHGSR